MSETAETLQRKIDSAKELNSVARTMKALAAASIGQYEAAVRSLNDYYRTIQLGLVASLRQDVATMIAGKPNKVINKTSVIVYGSDQGMVGQFNDILVNFISDELTKIPGEKTIWAVGERIRDRLDDQGLTPRGLFGVPQSINTVTPLIGQILMDTEAFWEDGSSHFILFYNSTRQGSTYQPSMQNLLPLEEAWQKTVSSTKWPSNNLPQVVGDNEAMLRTLIREYVFVSLFRACVESLASENASRLAAMQRAEKNIEDLLNDLNAASQRLRQTSIDEELFDVIAGYEMLAK